MRYRLITVALIMLCTTGCTSFINKVVLPAYSHATLDVPDVNREDVICFALYTVQNGILKMTVQLYPLKKDEPRAVALEVLQDGKWQRIASSAVIEEGWTAHFRVEEWDSARDIKYRAVHNETAYYEGLIRRDPVDKEVITVAAFTGNAIYKFAGGDIPKDDIITNLKMAEPDLLFFSGDQVYDHFQHYAYWLRFGRDFGEIIRNTPTVSLPDDHDVGQDNLWGAEGKKSEIMAGDDGGYYQSFDYVRMVERAQTSHLPDPYDPTPVRNGIGVYYTSLNIGGIDFAIIEDRKFKSAPPAAGTWPQQGGRPDHIVTPDYNPADLDDPQAKLLGDRQLKFLNEWAQDWEGAEMKAVLSATIFAQASHLSGKYDHQVYADLDTNGWPQSGRNRALHEIRRAYAFMIAGDQHLATFIRHGIDEWGDAGYSFCVPSIANFYPRWWAPAEPGKNRPEGMPEYLGDHKDGFGNKITMLAVANPTGERKQDRLTSRAAGYGIITFDKTTREITSECWPRGVNMKTGMPYEGWPITVTQQDNYGRKAVAWLPEIRSQEDDPVIQIINEENGEVVYTLRIKGRIFRPKVFKEGLYTIKITERQGTRILRGVQSEG